MNGLIRASLKNWHAVIVAVLMAVAPESRGARLALAFDDEIEDGVPGVHERTRKLRISSRAMSVAS